jgi:hypothetical protein
VCLLAVAALIPTVALTSAQANAQPVGLPGLPIEFHIRDNVDSWFDTNVSLFGDRSLAAAVIPRIGPAGSVGGTSGTSGSSSTGGLGLPDLGSTPGLLGSSTQALSQVINSVVPGVDLQQLAGAVQHNSNALIGSLGIDPLKLLGLDKLQTNITKLFGNSNPLAQRADADIAQIGKLAANRPVSAPLDLGSLPVGVDLQGLLDDMKKITSTGAPVSVDFNVSAPTSAGGHDVSSLIWPDGAKGFPFTQPASFIGDQQIQLTQPGLYAFFCKLHPYMLGAIVVTDPLSIGLSFGKKLDTVLNNLSVPSTADIMDQLVYTFFKITAPENWQTYATDHPTVWAPKFPVAPILKYDINGNPVLIPDLDAYFDQKFGLPKVLPAANLRPSVPGVGEVWVDTQMETWAGKDKPGSITEINADDWSIERKIGAPQIDMNNAHNQWTDKDYKYIMADEWWNNRTDVFDRKTGAFLRSVTVGPDPSHIMSRPNNDELMVDINGGNSIAILAPGATKVLRQYQIASPTQHIAMPHGQWMTSDGQYGVTPDVGLDQAGIINLDTGQVKFGPSGVEPLAVGIPGDDSRYYMANFLSSYLTCGSLEKENACADPGTGQMASTTNIDLWSGYDPAHFDPTGNADQPMGGLSIQNPVSPDGKAELVANVLGGTTLVDARTNKVVKTLPCTPGCHGVQFGVKKGGGYYAYEASKFANMMYIYDLDPAGDGDLSKASVVGEIVLAPEANTKMDGTITQYAGMGGQGVLPIPLVYNGWSENPNNAQWNLTCKQIHPVTFATDCK